MEQFQIEQATALARIEENVNFLKQSYVEEKEKREKELHALQSRVKELETFKEAIQRKIAYIGGVMVVVGTAIGMLVPSLINWVSSHIHWRAP